MKKKELISPKKYELLLISNIILIIIILFLTIPFPEKGGKEITPTRLVIREIQEPETDQIRILNPDFLEKCCYTNKVKYPNGIISQDLVCKRRNKAKIGTFLNVEGKRIDIKKCSEMELYVVKEVIKDA